MPKVYISPSTQESNQGLSPFTTEEAEMNKIADMLIMLLGNDELFRVKRNSTATDPYQCAADSNDFKADIHVAIHSNAGGGEGTEVFAYSSGTNSEKLAKALYDKVAPLSPGSDRGVKFKPGLIEVGDSVNATSCLIELAFHDNAKDATWLVNGRDAIAMALYQGICDYFGYKYSYACGGLLETKQDKDGYLLVRVLDSKAAEVRSQIIKMGYACAPMVLP